MSWRCCDADYPGHEEDCPNRFDAEYRCTTCGWWFEEEDMIDSRCESCYDGTRDNPLKQIMKSGAY